MADKDVVHTSESLHTITPNINLEPPNREKSLESKNDRTENEINDNEF